MGESTVRGPDSTGEESSVRAVRMAGTGTAGAASSVRPRGRAPETAGEDSSVRADRAPESEGPGSCPAESGPLALAERGWAAGAGPDGRGAGAPPRAATGSGGRRPP